MSRLLLIAVLCKCISLFLMVVPVGAIYLDPDDPESIKDACSIVADGLLKYYWPTTVVGKFMYPYYWWEAGAAWGSLIDYWVLTGDDKWVNITMTAILAQVGPDWDLAPPAEVQSLGNDDQCFWGLTVMQAAEFRFPDPPPDGPQWLALAQSVHSSLVREWQTDHCGGGVRWQKYSFNRGYDYKNSVSNGCFFQLSARLARYTGKEIYLQWSEKIWDWMEQTKLIQNTEWGIFVYDGAAVGNECSDIVKLQWTYNAGLLLAGAAYMHRIQNSERWKTRTLQLLDGAVVFFDKETGIMHEAACEKINTCSNDSRSFKAYLARFLSLTYRLIPAARERIRGHLRASAVPAANSCSGGDSGTSCGLSWRKNGWDGYLGMGEEMCALELLQSNLVLFMSEYSDTGPGQDVYDENDSLSPGTKEDGTSLDEDNLIRRPSTKHRLITGKDTGLAYVLMISWVISLALLAIWLIFNRFNIWRGHS